MARLAVVLSLVLGLVTTAHSQMALLGVGKKAASATALCLASVAPAGSGATTGTTVAASFASAVPAGCTILVGVTEGNNQTVSCADDKNTSASYVAIDSLFDTPNSQELADFIFSNVQNGPTTVTCTFGGAVGFRSIVIAAVAGLASSGAVDKHGIQTNASGTSFSSPSITPTVNGDYLWSVYAGTSGGLRTISASAPFTLDANNTGAGGAPIMGDSYFQQVTAAAISSTFTANATGTALAAIAAIEPYAGPGDTVAYTAWWGLRAYKGSVVTTGTAGLVNIRRASDNATCAIIVSNSGGLGLTAGTTSGTYACSAAGNENESIATFCAATTCTAVTLYDQTVGLHCGGASCDATQATAANQPAITANCVGTFYCLQSTAASMKLASANSITPATGVVSMSVVGDEAVGTSNVNLLQESGTGNNRMISTASSVDWELAATSGTCIVAAAAAKWHAANGFIGSGASASALNIDAVVTSSCTVTGSATAGNPAIAVGLASTTFDFVEAGILDNTTFGATTDTTLCKNEQAYWGASNFGATC